MSPQDTLAHAAVLITRRVQELERQLESSEGALWSDYLAAVEALAAVLGAVAPDRRGELLTTKQLADRMHVAPKTLLAWRRRGIIKPAVQAGRRGRGAFRWRGNEVAR